MHLRVIPFTWRFILLSSIWASVSLAEESSTLVISVGNSESFDNSLPVLRYPSRDARRFQSAMIKTGGVSSNQIITLANGKIAEFRKAMAEAAVTAKKAKTKKFILYYTGHSDASGFHFVDGLLKKAEFHKLLGDVPAKVRVVFLDSCFSGALTSKGLKKADPFTIPKAEVDEPSGAVFLAASSSSDYAYEVSELEGSLFTHHLVSGMYGQADLDNDSLITIDELYQYISREMRLSNVTLPLPNFQKPEFNVDLKGRGSLILAQLEKSTAVITLEEDLYGEITFISKNGLLHFRQFKEANKIQKLRLIPGSYRVALKNNDTQGEADVTLAASANSSIGKRDFKLRKFHDYSAMSKGSRERSLLVGELGYHSGFFPYSQAGGQATFNYYTTGIPIRMIVARLALSLHGRQNRLGREGEQGDESAMGLNAGMRLSYLPNHFLPGQKLHFQILGGGGFFWQKYDDNAVATKRFHRGFTQFDLGIGTSIPLSESLLAGFMYHRQWNFVTDQESNDVLALGGNLFSLTLAF